MRRFKSHGQTQWFQRNIGKLLIWAKLASIIDSILQHHPHVITMRFHFLIINSVNCVFVRHYGIVDTDIIKERVLEVRAHEDFVTDLNQFVDYRGCDIEITTSQLMAQAQQLTKPLVENSPPGQMASLVDSDLFYGIHRMYEAYTDEMGLGGKLRVFRGEEQAKEWVRLAPDYDLPF